MPDLTPWFNFHSSGTRTLQPSVSWTLRTSDPQVTDPQVTEQKLKNVTFIHLNCVHSSSQQHKFTLLTAVSLEAAICFGDPRERCLLRLGEPPGLLE
jgi:hypothetical protein